MSLTPQALQQLGSVDSFEPGVVVAFGNEQSAALAGVNQKDRAAVSGKVSSSRQSCRSAAYYQAIDSAIDLGHRRGYSTLAGILLTDISGLATWFSNWSAFSSSPRDLDNNCTTAV